MTNRKIAIAFILAALAATVFISSCKKKETGEPLEPISIIKPDSAIITRFPGDSVPYEIKFTTDRPINWIRGMYDIDTSDAAGYIPTYPDTLFFIHLDSLDPRVNIYSQSGLYHIPDTLKPYSVVYFKMFYEAGKANFTTGQNYPAGIVAASKTFKVNVR